MQIQLKQPEIVTALKQFIASQGISLAGKSVEMTFTAGRKEGGTSVDIVIEDVTIPGTEVGDAVAGTGLKLVPAAEIPAVQPTPEPSPEVQSSPEPEKAPVNSLFGS